MKQSGKETITASIIQWINQPLINKSEVARQIGISTILFRMKLKNINRNRFTSDELKKLDEVRTRLL
jgi:predicted transcriptional regulator